MADLISGLTEFRWNAPTCGYKLVKWRLFVDHDREASGTMTRHSVRSRRAHWVLSVNAHPNESVPVKAYHPLRLHPDLFRRFARLSPDDHTACRRFADDYGWLGVHVLARHPDGIPVPVELMTHWADHIRRMDRAVWVWERWATDDADGLKQRLSTVQVEGELCWAYQHDRKVTDTLIRPIPGFPFSADDALTPASVLLSRLVNAELTASVQPALMCQLPSYGLVVRLRPLSLLGAMWLQFAEAVAGGDTVRECAECKKWFQVNVGADARKARRKFCSNLCKLHDYRRRQAAAARMASAGRKPREIANELGTDLRTVKAWIQKSKRGG